MSLSHHMEESSNANYNIAYVENENVLTIVVRVYISATTRNNFLISGPFNKDVKILGQEVPFLGIHTTETLMCVHRKAGKIMYIRK